MKGKSLLFAKKPRPWLIGKENAFRFALEIQLFANRVSDKGIRLQAETQNPKLRNFIGEYYRAGAKIGDGGLADAIRRQRMTGELVGGKDHFQKGRERVKNLQRILAKEPLSQHDRSLAERLLRDLLCAFGEEGK